MSRNVDDTGDEVERRQRAASLFVLGGIAFTLLLTAVTLSGATAGALGPNPALSGSLLIVVVFLGVGAVVLRRTRTNATRLSDIAGLRGVSGLVESLQKTTLYVALIGYSLALLGFVGGMLAQQPGESVSVMVRIGVIAVAVLLYAYPRRAAWRRVVEAFEQSAPGG